MKTRTILAVVLTAIFAIAISGCISVKFGKDKEVVPGKEIEADKKAQVEKAVIRLGFNPKKIKGKHLWDPILLLDKQLTAAKKEAINAYNDNLKLRNKISVLESQLAEQIKKNKKLCGNTKDMCVGILGDPKLPERHGKMFKNMMQRNMEEKLEE